MIPLPSLDAKKVLLKKQIQAKVYEGLYNGMLASFGDIPVDDDNVISQISDTIGAFAEEASGPISDGIADAIDAYVKSLIVNVPAAPQASLVAGPVPVTGTVLIPDTMIMLG